LLEVRRIDGRDVLVEAFDFEPEAGGEVLLVADHHVDVLGDVAVDLLRALLAALALPEGSAVIEVVGDDGAVLARHLDGLDDGFGGIGRERREDAAGVEPAHAFFAKQLLPVHLAGPDLRRGRMTPIAAAERRADAEALLGEVEADARIAAQAVELAPDDLR